MEVFGQIVEWLRACLAEGVITLAVLLLALLACLCARFVLRRLRLFLRMGLFGIVLAVAAVLISDKPPAGTNDTDNAGAPARMVRRVASAGAAGVTDEDIVNGWREVSRRTDALGASVFAVPEDGLAWDEVRARGARRGYWHIPATGWSFSGASFGWTNGFVWAEGMFRPKVESTRDGLVILNHGLALAPAANWERYGLDASLFWCRTNAVGGLVGTFLGAAVDDDPAKIVNAQFEFFPADGRLALRYDLSHAGEEMFEAGPFEEGEGRFVSLATNTSEVVLQRVHPDDWDMDGIPNALDEEPRVPNTTPAWGQSEEWAALAFPSNAAEIAAAGGYLAWATARGSETNRHLVGLNVESPDGVWPICVTFGELQVMCNSTNTLYFAIDDGARYAYELSAGRLAAVEVCGEDRFETGSFDGDGPVDRVSYPGLVTVRLETLRTGWIGRLPTVEVAGLEYAHFFPGDSLTVTAQVSNCHADAYRGCTWLVDSDISFSDIHAPMTAISWNGDVNWATSRVALVTAYAGDYAVTNIYVFSVGSSSEPETELSLACQEVFFKNEDEFGRGDYSPFYMPERIRPVGVRLRAAAGLKGEVVFSFSEWTPDDPFSQDDEPVLYRVVDGVTNRLYAASSVPLEIGVDCFGREDATEVFMSCPSSGSGSLLATLTLTNGCVMTRSAPFRVVNPIRRLVTTDRRNGRPVNPSRLVWGTNAVLHVDAFGGGRGLSPDEVQWRVVSGHATLASTNGFYNVVTPTADDGVVTVEARMNGDEIQPTFVLPVVRQREVPLRVFVVDPPRDERYNAWKDAEIQDYIDGANKIFQQVGIKFVRIGDVEHGLSSVSWSVRRIALELDATGGVSRVTAPEAKSLLGHYQRKTAYVANDCIEVYFTGKINGDLSLAFTDESGIVVTLKCSPRGFAHELGHALGLKDSYHTLYRKQENEFPPLYPFCIYNAGHPVDRWYFCCGLRDWGAENGRGFYSETDRREVIAEKSLMYGIDIPSAWDIPDGKVDSLYGYGRNPFAQIESKIGAEHIKATNAEVFTK